MPKIASYGGITDKADLHKTFFSLKYNHNIGCNNNIKY